MKKTILALAMATCSMATQAGEYRSLASARENVSITVYNGNVAMIKDKRLGVDTELGDKSIDLVFDGVSDQLIPETVNFSGGSLKEFNYSYDLMSHESMLRSMLGQSIKVIDNNNSIQQGKLLSVNGNRIFVERSVDQEVLSFPKDSPSWTYSFTSVPDNLTASPTLILKLNELKGDRIELDYLTHGFSWKANYVAELIDVEKLKISSWVTLINNTSTSYKDAQLNLIAGSLNINRPERQRNMEMMAMKSSIGDSMAPQEQTVGDYKLYKIPFATDIDAKQQKQLSLFSKNNVTYLKTYEYVAGNAYYGNTEKKKSKASAYISLENTEDKGLGLAMPRGPIRFYQRDEQGELHFSGENIVNDLDKGQKSSFLIGETFDLSIEEAVEYEERISKRAFIRTHNLEVTNSKDSPVTLSVVHPLNSNMRIMDHSDNYEKIPGKGFVFKVIIPAESQKIIRYTMRYD